jgi:hypothetical protein
MNQQFVFDADTLDELRTVYCPYAPPFESALVDYAGDGRPQHITLLKYRSGSHIETDQVAVYQRLSDGTMCRTDGPEAKTWVCPITGETLFDGMDTMKLLGCDKMPERIYARDGYYNSMGALKVSRNGREVYFPVRVHTTKWTWAFVEHVRRTMLT